MRKVRAPSKLTLSPCQPVTVSLRGFTLIELLVAISIIVVLIAILVPSLSHARGAARRTVCAANLHHLGIATNAYLDFNSGYFWPYNTDQAAPAGRVWWFGFEANGPGTGTNRPLDKSLSPLAPFTANLADQMQCPDFPYNHPGFFPKFNRHAASYGYNLVLGPTPPAATQQRHAYTERSARVFVFADGVQLDGLGSPGSFNEAVYIQHGTGFSGYAQFRHILGGGPSAQIVYLDGHVDSQPATGIASKVAGYPTGNLNDPAGWQMIYGK